MHRRGYDVFAFASAGASVAVGLDICPIAIQAAQEEQQLEIGDNPAACAVSKLVAGDFFSHDSSTDFQGPYDVGYDYTFLCALHPGGTLLLLLLVLSWRCCAAVCGHAVGTAAALLFTFDAAAAASLLSRCLLPQCSVAYSPADPLHNPLLSRFCIPQRCAWTGPRPGPDCCPCI